MFASNDYIHKYILQCIFGTARGRQWNKCEVLFRVWFLAYIVFCFGAPAIAGILYPAVCWAIVYVFVSNRAEDLSIIPCETSVWLVDEDLNSNLSTWHIVHSLSLFRDFAIGSAHSIRRNTPDSAGKLPKKMLQFVEPRYSRLMRVFVGTMLPRSCSHIAIHKLLFCRKY